MKNCHAHWRGAAIIVILAGGSLWASSVLADGPERIKVPTDELLCGICFVDERTGWVVGAKGTILKTVDGGKTWTKQKSGSDALLGGVAFVDAKTGWVVGGWGTNPPGFKKPLGRGHYLGGPKSMAYSTILKTEDGGKTWRRQPLPTNFGLRRVRALNANRAWIAAAGPFQHPDGDVWMTDDGGASWQKSPEAYRTTRMIMDIFVRNAQTVWAVGTNSVIGLHPVAAAKARYKLFRRKGAALFSEDGGESWEPRLGDVSEIATHTVLTGVTFADTKHGWICGFDVKTNVSIILLTQDGKRWKTARIPRAVKSLQAITFGDLKTGWAVGEGEFLSTRDGGKTWKRPKSLTEAKLRDVVAVRPGTVWAVGDKGVVLRYKKPGGFATVPGLKRLAGKKAANVKPKNYTTVADQKAETRSSHHVKSAEKQAKTELEHIQPGQTKLITLQEPQCKFELYVPRNFKRKRGRTWPLIVFLHGVGGAGTVRTVANLVRPSLQKAGDKYLLAVPQSPSNGWRREKEEGRMVGGMLSALVKQMRVDRKQIYLWGYSQGGIFGTRLTFAYAQDPDLFRAIILIHSLPGAGPNPRKKGWDGYPVRMVIGKKDPIFGPPRAAVFKKRLVARGIKLTYVEIPEGHPYTPAHQAETLEWMAKFSKY